jgi:hypothetical protein
MLFLVLQAPFLSPLLLPVNRWKRMDGVVIARPGGFSLRHASARVKARCEVAPVAEQDEALVYCGLGIVKN